jgi:hypothetical protein
MNSTAFHCLVALILSACGRYPVTAHYTSELLGTGHIAFEETVSKLESKTGSKFLHDPSGQLSISVHYGDFEESDTIGMAEYDDETCTITIANRINPDRNAYYKASDLQQVIAHEIGHCFGLPHHPDKHEIMYYLYLPELQKTEAAFDRLVEQLKFVRGDR